MECAASNTVGQTCKIVNISCLCLLQVGGGLACSWQLERAVRLAGLRDCAVTQRDGTVAVACQAESGPPAAAEYRAELRDIERGLSARCSRH